VCEGRGWIASRIKVVQSLEMDWRPNRRVWPRLVAVSFGVHHLLRAPATPDLNLWLT